MGGCPYFRATWWPRGNDDVIDPNKEFDYQRRMVLLRRFILLLVIVALIVGFVFLVLKLTSSGDNPDCSRNNTKAQLQAPGNFSNSSMLHNSEPQALTNATEYHLNSSEIETHHRPTDEMISGILNSNESLVENEDIDKVLNESDVAVLDLQNRNITEEHTNTNEGNVTIASETRKSENESFKNTNFSDSTKPVKSQAPAITEDQSNSSVVAQAQDDLGTWCSTKKQHVFECVALSRNFKTVTTFLDHRMNNNTNATASGYLMVKRPPGTWHPYCHRNWTLEMGYKLCRGLGFSQLQQLETIDIFQLRDRVTHKLGKRVRFQLEGSTRPQPDLLVLHGSGMSQHNNSSEGHVHQEKVKLNTTDAKQYSCDVGFISCK